MQPRTWNRHGLVMLLCCLVPVAAVGGALLLGAALSSALVLGLVLLCPLAHVLMMATMHQEDSEFKQEQAPAEHPHQEAPRWQP